MISLWFSKYLPYIIIILGMLNIIANETYFWRIMYGVSTLGYMFVFFKLRDEV